MYYHNQLGNYEQFYHNHFYQSPLAPDFAAGTSLHQVNLRKEVR